MPCAQSASARHQLAVAATSIPSAMAPSNRSSLIAFASGLIDQPGVKYAEQVAAAYGGCRGVTPPRNATNGTQPPTKVADIAD